ncbi:MAG: HAD family hydrolase [Bacillota bacterium]
MGYKAIIFDLDGTLLDTLKDLALSVNAVLRQHGLSEHPVASYRYFVGDGIDILVKRAFPAESIKSEKDVLYMVNAVKEEYTRRWGDHTRPYPGIPAMLDSIEEKRLPKAIFSNKPHEFAVLTVNKLLPDWKFEEVCGIQSGIPRKPDPYGALMIAEKIMVKPEEVVYLGDTDTDMLTAVRGGFYPVGALWGFRSAEELLKSGAAMLAQKPKDVAEFFD